MQSLDDSTPMLKSLKVITNTNWIIFFSNRFDKHKHNISIKCNAVYCCKYKPSSKEIKKISPNNKYALNNNK